MHFRGNNKAIYYELCRFFSFYGAVQKKTKVIHRCFETQDFQKSRMESYQKVAFIHFPTDA